MMLECVADHISNMMHKQMAGTFQPLQTVPKKSDMTLVCWVPSSISCTVVAVQVVEQFFVVIITILVNPPGNRGI